LEQPAALQLFDGQPCGGRLRFSRRTFPIQPLAEQARQSSARQSAAAPVKALNDCRTELPPANNHAAEDAAKNRRRPAEKLWDTLRQ
jgi:hypothetical protein